MRILVLSNLYPPDILGGYELGCRQVVDALIARGHEVRVVTSAPRGGPVPAIPHVRRRFAVSEVWSHYLFEHSAPVTNHLTQSQASRIQAPNCYALIDELSEFDPDVAYVWMLEGLGGIGLMGCLDYLKVPWLWHLMDCVPLILCKIQGSPAEAFTREFERFFADGHYVACSTQLYEEIRRGGVRIGPNAQVIPNWVAGPLPTPRQRYLQDGLLRIAAASALISQGSDKGIDIVIKSASALRKLGYENFLIDIFGKSLDSYCEDLIRVEGLEGHVAMRGQRSQAELQAIYNQYDLFAFPTRAREPFAFVALEASAGGCVPVMSEVCGNSEWFVDGVHVLKAARNPGALAEVYARVLRGEVDLEQIGRRLANVIARDFHLETVMPQIERALERAANRPRTGAGSAADAYRLALLADRLNRVVIQDWQRA